MERIKICISFFVTIVILFYIQFQLIARKRGNISLFPKRWFVQRNELLRTRVGDVIDGIHELNYNLSKLRNHILKTVHLHDDVFLGNDSLVKLSERNERFYEDLKNVSGSFNLAFYVNNSKIFKNLSVTENVEYVLPDESFVNQCFNKTSRILAQCPTNFLLLDKYYRLTSTQEFCNWVVSGSINSDYGFYYNFTCNTDVRLASKPSKIYIKFYPQKFNMKNSIKMIPSNLNYLYNVPDVLYPLQIYTNAIINDQNEVFINDFHIEPNDCSSGQSRKPTLSEQKKLPQHDEVFLISQFWGEGFFHKMIEDIPRLSLFIKFLQENPEIKILSKDSSKKLIEIMNLFNLNQSRLVTGSVRAKVAYVPRSTSCGAANVLELQYLHRQYRRYILKNLVNSTFQPRNKLLLIKRTVKRLFLHYENIFFNLKTTARDHGLEFYEYSDNPVPSLNETMIAFGSASIIVAPHGAGLSNIVFSQPGTLIIEALCYLPNVNLCYQQTSHILGMQWHGIPSKGCGDYLDTDASLIDDTLKSYLNVIPISELIN